MILAEIRSVLKTHKNERGIAQWKKTGNKSWGTYGIGLTQLKKIAKSIGNDRNLAKELRQQPNYEMKVLSFLVDEPKKIPLEETKRTILKMSMWSIGHVYIQSVFSKLPYAMELATIYRGSHKEIERRCGYGYLQYAAKNKKIPDEYFVPIISRIERKLQDEENFVKDAMNTAILAIGQRSIKLHALCLKAAKNIGKIIIYHADGAVTTTDLEKLLNSPATLEKLQQKARQKEQQRLLDSKETVH